MCLELQTKFNTIIIEVPAQYYVCSVILRWLYLQFVISLQPNKNETHRSATLQLNVLKCNCVIYAI